MRKITYAAVLAAIAVPTAAIADTTPSPDNETNAARQCKTMRGTQTADQFAQSLKALGITGINANGRNAFGKCVSHFSRQDAKQEDKAHTGAVSQCRGEQALSDQDFAAQVSNDGNAANDTFATFYGTGKGKNAFGKCVSKHAKQNKDDADQDDQQEAKDVANAAKKCKDPTFRAQQTNNSTAKNAFGKCVSKTAHELHEARSA
jgi:hypothetical protein